MVLTKDGLQMGYLTAERCGWVKRQIELGAEVKAIFQTSKKWGAVIRATFDGNDPDLPPERYDENGDPDSTGDTDFYPDWIPPDE